MRRLLLPFIPFVLAACTQAPAGPRPTPLALDEAPFVRLSQSAREELTLRPDRSYVLRRIPLNQKPIVTSGHYDVLHTNGQIIALDFKTPLRIIFSPAAPTPLSFEYIPVTGTSTIPPDRLNEYTLLSGQWQVRTSLLAPQPPETPISHLLPPIGP